MARSIRVDADKLRNWANEIKAIAEDYQFNYSSLLATADSLSGSWIGEDNVAFQKKVHEFDDDFKKMMKEILQYASYLEKTAKVYDVVRNVAQKKAGALKGNYNDAGGSGGGGSFGGAGATGSFGSSSSGGGGSSGGAGSSRSFGSSSSGASGMGGRSAFGSGGGGGGIRGSSNSNNSNGSGGGAW